LYPDRPEDPRTFDLKFKVIPSRTDRDAPVVIGLTGGPDAIIGRHEFEVPDSFHVILPDPRGEGCNAGPEGLFSDPRTFRSEYYARDVMEIIKRWNLTNYFVRGTSFGTLHATVMTNLIERDCLPSPEVERQCLPSPRALVLEGILGRPYASFIGDYFQGFVREWTRVRQMLDPRIVAQLTNGPLPLELHSREWSFLIRQWLMEGQTPGRPHPATILNYLVPDNPLRELAEGAIRNYLEASYAAGERSSHGATVVACREYMSGTRANVFDVVNGELTASGNECVEVGVGFEEPYDAANRRIAKTPIYYFQGPFDPATHLEQATHHFTAQNTAENDAWLAFVAVAGAAHSPLRTGLFRRGCSTAIWNAIAFNPSGLQAALTQCQWPMSLTWGYKGAVLPIRIGP
jgi:pimeloyl-ACP methyl ester carboxylesterase